MRFALSPGDVRVQVLVATLDEGEVPFAETWRRVGEAAEELGFTRPGYHLVRVLARAERLRPAGADGGAAGGAGGAGGGRLAAGAGGAAGGGAVAGGAGARTVCVGTTQAS